MLILNCGGTFNKRYNAINGTLDVPFDNDAIETILKDIQMQYSLAGVIYKDSIEMDEFDRKTLANIIIASDEENFIVVHGTDTMDLSAEFLAETVLNKRVVFTGAMKPFEINNIEATFNLAMACGFLNALPQTGVYICMSGHIAPWDKIVKNRVLGRFELV